MTTNIHEPTPEFRRYLEWQVVTAVRRRSRFAEPARTGYRSYLGVASVVIVSMLLGAAGVMASSQIQVNQQKQLLVTQQQGEMQLAQMQVVIAQKAVEDARWRAESGMTGEETVASAERDLQSATLKVQRIKLNIDEVGRSGRAVQDDLTSPVVDGRDFVVERLQLDLRGAVMAVEGAERRLRGMKFRHEAGLANSLELLDAEADVTRSVSEARTVQGKIALRQQFVSGGVAAEEATKQRLLLAARNQLEAAQASLNVAAKRYEWLQSQFEIGTANEVDVLKAQLDMLSKRQDVTTLQARIRALEGGGR